MRCSMCGYEFEEKNLTCHASCPLGAACMVICCPRCGYSTIDPRRSKLTRWARQVRRSLGRNDTAKGTSGALDEGVISLLDMKPGQEGQVADTTQATAARGNYAEGQDALAQVSHYGLLPGMPVQLRQRRPVPVVLVGQTEVAIDATVAARIYVRMADARGHHESTRTAEY